MQKLSPLFKLRNVLLDRIDDNKRHFLGEVLTIIDATIPDKEQRKAIKDLIQDRFYGNDMIRRNTREILLEFANKYCEAMSPKNNTEKAEFMGVLLGSSDEVPSPTWFQENK